MFWNCAFYDLEVSEKISLYYNIIDNTIAISSGKIISTWGFRIVLSKIKKFSKLLWKKMLQFDLQFWEKLIVKRLFRLKTKRSFWQTTDVCRKILCYSVSRVASFYNLTFSWLWLLLKWPFVLSNAVLLNFFAID